jgi:KDO2-lipid IV(A) lauroyltransferase
VLDRGGILATLGDQDAGQRGLFVDFFGRPASTHKAIALLALEYNVPMLVIGTPKMTASGLYKGEVEDLIRPEEYAGRPDAIPAITQRFTAALERLIRRHPEQYFWLHRRWKHQPPQKKGKQAA